MTNQLLQDFVKSNYQLKNPQHKDWETPPDFFKKLDHKWDFNLDVAANHENALCENYCTREGSFSTITGRAEMFDNADGLNKDWTDWRVFCNPPYDASLKDWVSKALRYEAEVAVMLLPPSVDTKWFHKLWDELDIPIGISIDDYSGKWNGVWSDSLSILFYEKRLRFWHDGKPGMAPRAGNMLAIFRR